VQVKVLFVFIVLEHHQRVLHSSVIEHPCTSWTSNRFTRPSPIGMHRGISHEIGIASRANEVCLGIASLHHLEEVLTARRSPWQNPYAEGLIASKLRDCMNQFVGR